MAKLHQVFQCKLGSALMIKHNVDDAFDLVMSRDGYDRNRQIMMPGRVHSDKPVHGSIQKHPGIFIDKVGPVAMTGDEIKVSFPEKMILDAAHDHCGISITHFRDDHADSEAALSAQ